MPEQPPRSVPGDADPTREARAESHARRDFLKASAAVTGASMLGGCLTEGGSEPSAPLAAEPPPPRFEHVVAVMFENRSFDCILGRLYAPGQVPRNQPYNGIAGVTYSNPVPPYIDDGHATVTTRISPDTDAAMASPNPDPGEEYQHVNTQLFGTVDPPGNAFLRAGDMDAPYNAPAPGTPATLTGFVHDYCNNFVATKKRHPTFDEYRVIMDGFGPEQLPVISTLAREFAVYDAWFCAAPTQTFCNRAFFHASSSSGQVNNAPYTRWLANTAPTIFNRLEDAGIPWKIYFDRTQIISLTGLIHAPALSRYWKTRFATMDAFYGDVAAGTLPAYAFVEPRTFFNHNDYHPPAQLVVGGNPLGHPSDVRAGELLLHQIYDALRTSPATTGSTALNTLMLVTFDEHGGTFDHVAPPPAVPPHELRPSGQYGFRYDRLGVRVPTIAISAYTQSNTVINRPMHHAALIRTLCAKHGLPHLTERDREAPDLSDAYNLTRPRAASTWPVTVPRPVPPAVDIDPLSPATATRPLNELEQHVVGLAMAYFLGHEPAASEIPTTIGAAYALLEQIAGGAFGPA